jgi:hypothetical protein
MRTCSPANTWSSRSRPEPDRWSFLSEARRDQLGEGPHLRALHVPRDLGVAALLRLRPARGSRWLRRRLESDGGHRPQAARKHSRKNRQDVGRALHDEGALAYLAACRKKASYATGIAAFRRKHGSRALASHLRRPYFEHPPLLLAQPTLALGALVLKKAKQRPSRAVSCSTRLRGRTTRPRQDHPQQSRRAPSGVAYSPARGRL